MSFSEIAAITVHDVKNRLAQLAGRAEAKGDRDTQRVAMEAAGALSALLAFHRIASGTLPVEIEARSPADLLAELVANAILPERFDVVTDAGEAPVIGYYDEGLVRMTLANAIHNAQRHARSRIELSATARDGWLEFAVGDDGPGYPPSVLADQGASAPVTRDGTGLGLRLAARVAEMHTHAGRAGTVELRNDGGAVFRLRLPQ